MKQNRSNDYVCASLTDRSCVYNVRRRVECVRSEMYAILLCGVRRRLIAQLGYGNFVRSSNAAADLCARTSGCQNDTFFFPRFHLHADTIMEENVPSPHE